MERSDLGEGYGEGTGVGEMKVGGGTGRVEEERASLEGKWAWFNTLDGEGFS